MVTTLKGRFTCGLGRNIFLLGTEEAAENKRKAKVTRGSTKMLKSKRRAFAFQLALR